MKREDEAADTPQADASNKGGLLVVVGVLLLSLVVGGLVGTLVLGPRVAQATSGTPAADAGDHAADEGHETEDHGGGGHGESGSGGLFTLESLVVNPAGTNGTRFLIVSLAVEPTSSSGVETLKAHEPEIRDRLLQVLASKTVEQLSSLELRDSLKVEIVSAIDETVPSAGVHRLFMPQYVLQ